MKEEALRRLNFLLKAPFDVTREDTYLLHEALQEFPYFQPLRMLYLKGLKRLESSEYQQALKQAAVYCADRSLLFNYISKEEVHAETVKAPTSGRAPRGLPTQELDEAISRRPDCAPSFQTRCKFSSHDQYTFCDWLKLSKVQPVEKTLTDLKDDRADKFKAIEQFLRNYSGPSLSKSSENTVYKTRYNIVENEDLVTETLARIYVEQKKYTKAIKAYKILSLKYPEKSGSFADRIRSIKKEIENQ